MKNTIVVNLFGGPGVGKSTSATWLFSQLKILGIDCEYVSEFAKDKVWENNDEVFKCQMYISGKQAFKISRCIGKVDVIITDSPIAIGAQYNIDNPYLNKALLYEFNKYNNMNFLLSRKSIYNPNGRHQTEEEAKKVDESTEVWLKENNIDFTKVDGTIDGYNEILAKILEKN